MILIELRCALQSFGLYECTIDGAKSLFYFEIAIEVSGEGRIRSTKTLKRYPAEPRGELRCLRPGAESRTCDGRDAASSTTSPTFKCFNTRTASSPRRQHRVSTLTLRPHWWCNSLGTAANTGPNYRNVSNGHGFYLPLTSPRRSREPDLSNSRCSVCRHQVYARPTRPPTL